ncbi:hypothetical protein GCM10009836_06720 [Pseudonocardia ailaonensis]|uniref:Uncharacterized protein n=1 Tax=Pseudonocardia ailaonensis TaxID=367279 RepID=A0ABN2MLR3_9PSEU
MLGFGGGVGSGAAPATPEPTAVPRSATSTISTIPRMIRTAAHPPEDRPERADLLTPAAPGRGATPVTRTNFLLSEDPAAAAPSGSLLRTE